MTLGEHIYLCYRCLESSAPSSYCGSYMYFILKQGPGSWKISELGQNFSQLSNTFGHRSMLEIYANADNFVPYIKDWVWFTSKNLFEKKSSGFWTSFHSRLSEIKLIVFNVSDTKHSTDFFSFCNLTSSIWQILIRSSAKAEQYKPNSDWYTWYNLTLE